MANIADNLKRLLGTEGNNIQEVLENADSIGGGSSDIPTIEFIEANDNTWSIDKTIGIDDPELYKGPCIIKFLESIVGSKIFIGNADNGLYLAMAADSLYGITFYIFEVSGDTVTYNVPAITFNHS